MARLNWKSDALATVIRPLPKGTGDPPKRHLRGNFFKTRVEGFDSGFFMLVLVIVLAPSSSDYDYEHEHEFDRIT